MENNQLGKFKALLNRLFGRYANFVLYIAIAVLINLVGISLFKSLRVDLTDGGSFSLSRISKKAVRELAEPLTIRVFFSKNLPPPHSDTERYLKDLLSEYAIAGNRNFNYEFYDCTESKADTSEKIKKNIKTAQDFGIQPVQIQSVEKDEVKFIKAYLGIVVQKGDILERIPTVDSTRALEYKLTTIIEQMNHKVSALLNLNGKISVKFFFTSQLQTLAPYFQIQGLEKISSEVNSAVEKAKKRNFSKIQLIPMDNAANPDLAKEAENYGIQGLQWRDFTAPTGQTFSAGTGYCALVIEYGGKAEKIDLLVPQMMLTFRGPRTVYQVPDLSRLDETINAMIDSILQINDEIGYIRDKGTLSLLEVPDDPRFAQFRQQGGEGVNFKKLLSQNYSVKEIAAGEVSKNIRTLVIAGAKETFSEYELFLLDQYLMEGRSLILFKDALQEVQADMGGMGGFGGQQPPQYLPINTGLEKLLAHYGVSIGASYVADKSCFEQQMGQQYGGGKQPFYFAPLILSKNINHDVKFLNNIRGLIMLKTSPVEVNEELIKANKIKATKLFSSSENGWLLQDRIMLNPMYLEPPSKDNMKGYALSYLLEGEFPSYFADKGIPQKDGSNAGITGNAAGNNALTGKNEFIKKGKKARIFVVGTSDILKNNILDPAGDSPNATFVMNVIDTLGDREGWAVMRSKSQKFNPINTYDPEANVVTKFFTNRQNLKIFNIALVPALLALLGLLVWQRRRARKKAVQKLYSYFS